MTISLNIIHNLSSIVLSIRFNELFENRWHLPLLAVAILLMHYNIKPLNSTLYWLQQEMSKKTKEKLIYSSIAIALVKLPFYIQPLNIGLDPSWIVGLNWAVQKQIQWGTQIIFTYGPTHWLLYHTLALDSSILIVSLISNIILFSCSVYVLIFNLHNAVRAGSISIKTSVILLFTLILVDYNVLDISLVSISIFLFLSNKRYKQNKFINLSIAAAFIMLSLISLCKFSYLAVSLCFLFFYSVFNLYNKKPLQVILAWSIFIVSFVLLWLLTGQEINNLPEYFASGFQIAQGYSEAMSYSLWNNSGLNKRYLIIFILAISFIGGLVILFVDAIHRKRNSWYLLLLNGPIVFLAFKEGFVRYDEVHYIQFFTQTLIISLGLIITLNQNQKKVVGSKFYLFFMFGICLLFTESFQFFRYKNLYALVDEQFRLIKLNEEKIKLVNTYKIQDSIINKLSNATVDIIPYEISFLYCHNLNWSPRPIIQSYSVYTSDLDSLNSSFFKGNSAPQQIIYTYKTIDDRYPLFDEPQMFKTLLNKYEWYTTLSNKKTVILRRKNHPIKDKIISSVNRLVSLNEKILIPNEDCTYTYAKAIIQLTLLGKVINFFCNVPSLEMKIYFKNNTKPVQFRLIRSTSDDGLLVSCYAKNVNDVMNIFSGTANPNVSGIAIIGNPYFYEKTIDLHFDLSQRPEESKVWLEAQKN